MRVSIFELERKHYQVIDASHPSHDHAKVVADELPGLYTTPAMYAEWGQFAACRPGTRDEQLEEIQAWRESGASQVYLLTGPAGSGKTAIAASVARSFDEAHALAAAFFFSPQNGTFFQMIGMTILSHLIKLPQLDNQLTCQLIFLLLGDDLGVPGPLKEQWDELIYTPLQASSALSTNKVAPFVVIFDGIDHLGPPFRDELLEFVAVARFPPQIKLLVTYRDEDGKRAIKATEKSAARFTECRLMPITSGYDASDLFGPSSSFDNAQDPLSDDGYVQFLQNVQPEALQSFLELTGALVVAFDPISLSEIPKLFALDSDVGPQASGMFSDAQSSASIQIYRPFSSFITDPARCKPENFLIVPEPHHEKMAQRCIRILSSLGKDAVSAPADIGTYTVAEYAAKNLLRHTMEVKSAYQDLWREIHAFLKGGAVLGWLTLWIALLPRDVVIRSLVELRDWATVSANVEGFVLT